MEEGEGGFCKLKGEEVEVEKKKKRQRAKTSLLLSFAGDSSKGSPPAFSLFRAFFRFSARRQVTEGASLLSTVMSAADYGLAGGGAGTASYSDAGAAAPSTSAAIPVPSIPAPAVASPLREDQISNAVSFLVHPKVVLVVVRGRRKERHRARLSFCIEKREHSFSFICLPSRREKNHLNLFLLNLVPPPPPPPLPNPNRSRAPQTRAGASSCAGKA